MGDLIKRLAVILAMVYIRAGASWSILNPLSFSELHGVYLLAGFVIGFVVIAAIVRR